MSYDKLLYEAYGYSVDNDIHESDAKFRDTLRKAISAGDHRGIVAAYKRYSVAGGGKAGFGARSVEFERLNAQAAKLSNVGDATRFVTKVLDKGYVVVLRLITEDGRNRVHTIVGKNKVLWGFIWGPSDLGNTRSFASTSNFPAVQIVDWAYDLYDMVGAEFGDRAKPIIAVLPKSAYREHHWRN